MREREREITFVAEIFDWYRLFFSFATKVFWFHYLVQLKMDARSTVEATSVITVNVIIRSIESD